MNDKQKRDDYSDELEEVWALFAQDGREALELVEETLLLLETDPTDAEQVARLFRGLHNFKGNARMMGLSVVETLTHQAEDLVALVRDEGAPLTGAMIDLLLEVLDRSQEILDHVVAHHCDVNPAWVAGTMTRLREMLNGDADTMAFIPPPAAVEAAGDDFTLLADHPSEILVEEVVLPVIDPTTDSLYVQIFLEMAENELTRLHTGLDALADGDEDEAASIIPSVRDILGLAAERMGYDQIVVLMDELGMIWGDREVARLDQLAEALAGELALIRGDGNGQPVDDAVSAPPPVREGEDLPVVSDPAGLFQRWCLDRLRADLTCLGETADGLEAHVRKFWIGSSVQPWDGELVAEAVLLLNDIYGASLYSNLSPAAHVTLALADLYDRAARQEMIANEALPTLTRQYVGRLTVTLDAGDAERIGDLSALLLQVEEILYLYADGRILQAVKDVLALTDLGPEFRDVMTPTNLLEVSRALRAGENLYTVLADLNQDGEIGQAFYEWARSDGVRLITNVTVFEDNRSLFKFLLTTAKSAQSVQADLTGLDSQGHYLSVEMCTLKSTHLADVDPPPCPAARAASPDDGVSGEVVDSLTYLAGNVGEMMATRATLHRVTERLIAAELPSAVTRWMEEVTASAEGERARDEWSRVRQAWDADMQTLSQVEMEIGAALGEFQEAVLALRARPAADILEPLHRLVQNVAQYQGKLIELDVQGGDLGLERNTLETLADPVQRLVWLLAVHSIEKPPQRREAGKAAVGRISVVVKQADDRVRVLLSDDGQGISGDQSAQSPASSGFGVELDAIRAALRARRGRLSIGVHPGQGAQLTLDMPLDRAVIDGMVVRVGDVQYVLPVGAVRRIVQPEAVQIVSSSAQGEQRMVRLEEELMPIQTLSGAYETVSPDHLLLIVERDDRCVALVVDELIGQQQVLIEPLQGCLADVSHLSGCALLGEGDVGMVLDLCH